MDHETASRIVNEWFGGDPEETFCSAVWRARWQKPWLWFLIWRIDREAIRQGEEPGHCRRAAINHRLYGAPPDDIVRLLGET